MTVSELNAKAKILLESHFDSISLSGELSKITLHSSGHWYFELKDERASISCAMFKGANLAVSFTPKVGDFVELCGNLSLYESSGRYQFIAKTMKNAGFGDLQAQFLALKERLEKEGLFNSTLKKPLPVFPLKIGIITSLTSAALQDMLKIINHKEYFLAQIFVFNALTQGEQAPNSLIKALQKAENKELDVIIIARGGGSVEDLFCFNDENLARAIFAAKTPIISAIGHEIDYVISDFVADFRAPTPSAAIDFLLKSKIELQQNLDELEQNMQKTMQSIIANLHAKLELCTKMLSLSAPTKIIQEKLSQITLLRQNLQNLLSHKMQKAEFKLQNLHKALIQHQAFFEKTKSLVCLEKNGKKIHLQDLQKNDIITLKAQNTSKEAQIL